MKANELRIGNYIYSQLGNFGKVISIEPNTVILVTSEKKVQCIDADCSGVPLTEEWLLKFGFEKQGMAYVRNDFDITKWSDGRFMYGGKINLHVDSIHQLQNLYYALTGEELQLSK